LAKRAIREFEDLISPTALQFILVAFPGKYAKGVSDLSKIVTVFLSALNGFYPNMILIA
jgi:hypothetical protein